MKKQLLTNMLATIAALFTMMFALPQKAMAEEYSLKIAGVQVTSDNCAHIDAAHGFPAVRSGTVKYDPVTCTLTLDNAVIETVYDNAIYLEEMYGSHAYTLVLKGNGNRLTATAGKALTTLSDLTITGGGSVQMTSRNNYGIYVYGHTNLTIKGGCNVTVEGEDGIHGENKDFGTLFIDGATVKAKSNGGHGSIYNFNRIQLKNSALTAPTGAYIAGGTVMLNSKICTEQVVIEPARTYGIYIGGVEINSANCNYIDAAHGFPAVKRGSGSYDPYDVTLTLNNAFIESYGPCIEFRDEDKEHSFALNLKGNNKISSLRDIGLDMNNGLIIKGGGSAQIEGSNWDYGCIHVGSSINLTITDGCTVTAEGSEGLVGLVGSIGIRGNHTSDLIIDGATVKAKGSEGSICGFYEITLKNCKLTAPSGAYIDDGDVKLNGEVCKEQVVIETVETYGITIDNEMISASNYTNISKSNGFPAVKKGTVKYDPATRTLTLDNAVIEGRYPAVSFEDKEDEHNFTLVLKGNNMLTSSGAPALSTDNKLTIRGGGSAQMKGTSSEVSSGIGVYNGTTLTITGGCIITAEGRWGITGANGNETLVVNDATVRAKGASGSICDFNYIQLKNCAITAPSGATIKNGAVKLNGSVCTEQVVIKRIDMQAPSGPTITSMTSTTTTITVNWTKCYDNVTPQDELRYRVWCGLAGGNVYSAGDIVTDQASYTVTGLTPDTEYTLYVTVLDKADNYTTSAKKTIRTKRIDTQAPSAPAITSMTSTTNAITVNWTKSTDNVTPQDELRYEVWCGLAGGNEYGGKDIVTNKTSYTVTSLDPDTEYELYVMAFDNSDNYVKSAKKTIRTKRIDTQAPSAPAITSMTATTNAITVNWTKSTDNVTPQNQIRYRVWCGLAGDNVHFAGDIVTNQTSYTVTGLEPDTEYELYVMAFDKAGNDASSAEKTIRTQAVQVEAYGIKIGGVEITADNYADISASGDFPAVKSGTVSYNPENRTLTLDNAVIEGNRNPISFTDEDKSHAYTLVLKGNGNKLSSTSNSPLVTFSNLTITGGGSAQMTSEDNCGIFVNVGTTLTITGDCSITAEGTWGISGQNGISETLIIDGATVKAKGNGNKGSICDFKEIQLKNCKLTAPTGAYIEGGNVMLNGKKCTEQVTIEAKHQTPNTVIIDGVEKPVLSHHYLDMHDGNFILNLYADDTNVTICSNPAFYKDRNIDLTQKETTTHDYWEWAVECEFNGTKLFSADGGLDMTDFVVFTSGTMRIDGDPAGTFDIRLWNGSITDPKRGDGKPHTISIKYSNDPTGIDTPTADVPARKQGIYNLQGVRLGTSLDGLPKGIYIVDGKKVVKK